MRRFLLTLTMLLAFCGSACAQGFGPPCDPRGCTFNPSAIVHFPDGGTWGSGGISATDGTFSGTITGPDSGTWSSTGISATGANVTPHATVTSATTSETTGAAGSILPIANPTGIVVGQVASGTNIPASDPVVQVSGGTALVTGLTAPVGVPIGASLIPVSNSTGLTAPMFILDNTNALASNTYITSIFGNASAAVTLVGATSAAGQAVINVSSGGTGCVAGMLAFDTTRAVIPTGAQVTGGQVAGSFTINANLTGAGVVASDNIVCAPALQLFQASTTAVVASDSYTFSPMVRLRVATTGSIASGATINFAPVTSAISSNGIASLGYVGAGDAGFQINGQTVFNTAPSNPNSPIFIGVNAGAKYQPALSGNVWDVVIGSQAMANWAGDGSEQVAIGTWAGRNLTSGVGANTLLGQVALANDCCGGSNTLMGHDIGYGLAQSSNNTAVGFNAVKYGSLLNDVAIGWSAMAGNSSSLAITCSPSCNSGDTLTLNYTSAAVNGGATIQIPYTVQGGDTAASIATNWAAAIVAASACHVNAPYACNAVAYNNYVSLNWHGTQYTGTEQPVLSVTQTGSGDETVTVADGNTSTGNTFVGNAAGQGLILSTGGNNTGIGQLSLESLTTGTQNAALGASSGAALTSGAHNTLLGAVAGLNETTGSELVCVGYSACDNGTTLNFSVVIGSQAGIGLTTSSNTVAIGYQALQTMTTVANSTVVGAYAGKFATTTITAFGTQAGQNLTSGAANAIFGQSALIGAASSTAHDNSVFGSSAMGATVTTADHNEAFGWNNLNSCTSCSGNVAIGWDVMGSSFTTGAGNIAIVGGTTAYAPSNPSNSLFIGNAGTSGSIVGTGINTSATEALTLYGTITMPNVSTSGTIAGSVCMTSANLLLYESGATGCTISLEELKHNIAPLADAGDFMRLEPISYGFNDPTMPQHRYGFGAHQVNSVDPVLSTFDGRGDLQAFDPNGILALTVAVVQRQQREIWALAAACLLLALWCSGMTVVLVRRR